MKKIRVVLSFLLVFTVLITIFFGKNLKDGQRVFSEKGYKGVISLWHIDSFEGGKGSRRDFLLKASRNFEKKNQGVLIMAINHTVNSAEEEMKKGNFPDMISFSNGLDITNCKELKTKHEYKTGRLGEKTLAAVWARGGYVLISHGEINEKKIKNLTVSSCDYTLPLVSFSLSGYSAESVVLKSPLDAYVDFINNKDVCLLGTQRDVIRLENRGYSAEITPLNEFSDLNQYIAICGNDRIKNKYSQMFIDYLLSNKVQMDLSEIGLLSVTENVNYDNVLDKMQGYKYSISFLTSKEEIAKIRDISILASNGDESAVKNLKNIVI